MDIFDNIKDTWQKADQQMSKDQSLTPEVIQNSISKESISITSKLLSIITIGIVFLFGDSLGFIYNAYCYRNNTLMFIIIISSILISFGSIRFLFFQIKKLKAVESGDMNLKDTLTSKINFYNKSFNWVLHINSLSVAFIPFVVNLSQESIDGQFDYKYPYILFCFYILTYCIMLFFSKISNSIYLKQLKNALKNLEQRTLDGIETELRKNRIIGITILVLTLILLISGVFAYFKFK